jgi:hypothetical protein
MRVVCQVIRDKTNKYQNLKVLPVRSFYGWATTIINACVGNTVELQYGKQHVYWYDNQDAVLAMQIHCSTENLNENMGVAYAGLTSGVPSPIYPGFNQVPIQPPWLPRVPLDEVWFRVDGSAKLAVWSEYQEIDYLCDSARGRFIPPEADKEDSRGLPNPTGQGEGENPQSGGADRTNAAPENGDGNGGPDPNSPLVLARKWYISFTIGVNGGPPVFLSKLKGPYDSKPTVTFGQELNTPPQFSTQYFINGVFQGVAESYGFPAVPRIERLDP